MTDVGFFFFLCVHKCTSRGCVTADTSSSRMKRPQWRRVGEEIGTWQTLLFFFDSEATHSQLKAAGLGTIVMESVQLMWATMSPALSVCNSKFVWKSGAEKSLQRCSPLAFS